MSTFVEVQGDGRSFKLGLVAICSLARKHYQRQLCAFDGHQVNARGSNIAVLSICAGQNFRCSACNLVGWVLVLQIQVKRRVHKRSKDTNHKITISRDIC